MAEKNLLLDVLRYTLPSLLMFIAVFFILEAFLRGNRKEKELDHNFELRKAAMKVTIPVQLQAYERLMLFLERINPQSSIYRVRVNGMSARDLQLALTRSIREEFEHNMSQQLYVSEDAWKLILSVKDEMIKLCNLIGEQMPEDSTSMDYSKAILEYFMNSKKDIPTQIAIDYLREDAKHLMV